jgi:hypothetical protein
MAAVIIKQGNTGILYYTETAHLGSIIGLVRANGTYKERYSYDACLASRSVTKDGGRRTIPKNWSYDTIPAVRVIDRSFNGHEHIDEFGLINMLSETPE